MSLNRGGTTPSSFSLHFKPFRPCVIGFSVSYIYTLGSTSNKSNLGVERYSGVLEKNGGSFTKTFLKGGIVTFTEITVDGVSVQFMFGYNADTDTSKGLVILNDPANVVGRIISISKTSGYNFTITNLRETTNVNYNITIT